MISCGKTVLNAQLGDSVKLKVEEIIKYDDENLEVKLVKVTEDSRCPQGTNCIWEGRVVVDLLVGDINVLVNTQTPKDTLGYSFTILSVEPVKTEIEISQEDYIIELNVTK